MQISATGKDCLWGSREFASVISLLSYVNNIDTWRKTVAREYHWEYKKGKMVQWICKQLVHFLLLKSPPNKLRKRLVGPSLVEWAQLGWLSPVWYGMVLWSQFGWANQEKPRKQELERLSPLPIQTFNWHNVTFFQISNVKRKIDWNVINSLGERH